MIGHEFNVVRTGLPMKTRFVPVLVLSWLSGAFAHAGEFSAGGYIFSDELGGFRIISVKGSGTSADPIVLEEEIHSVEPVTLVIQRRAGSGLPDLPRESLALTKVVHNRSMRIWGAFELELRERRGEPSGDADGLSFSQMDVQARDVSSDRFADNHRKFQPYDSIRFISGHVNPDGIVNFSVLITDTTPAEVFFLIQDPQLLAAERPMEAPARIYAERPYNEVLCADPVDRLTQ